MGTSHEKIQRSLIGLALLLPLGFVQGCARSTPLQPSNVLGAKQQLPFHPENTQTDAGAESQVAASPGSSSRVSLPFRTASRLRFVPSGTLLTVDLLAYLNAGKVHEGDEFRATVAAPLSIDGETLIQAGTMVVGRIESARSQPGQPRGGYLRLTLTSMTIDGRSIPLQTSSLFARGTAQNFPSFSAIRGSNQRARATRLQKGRALTFRLTAPVSVDGAGAIDEN